MLNQPPSNDGTNDNTGINADWTPASVVGPRPERPHFVEKFAIEVPRYRARHYLKVGITGWAQVNGWRGDTSIEKRIEHDLYYLQNWSLLFDLRIVVRTVLHTVNAKHAY